MSDITNEQWKAHLLVRLEYLREVMLVQAGESEKNILKIADIAEKLGIHPDTVKSIRDLASIITDIKDDITNITIMIKNLK
jgi:hypothetical protein